jgi:hypothetical protein
VIHTRRVTFPHAGPPTVNGEASSVSNEIRERTLAPGAQSSRGCAAGAVRTAVENDAAVWTEQVCEAGRLPTRFRQRCRRGHVLVAEAAFKRRSKMLSPALGFQDPWSEVERRLVAHVLLMATGELGNPLALCVEMKADDRTLHARSVRGGARGHARRPRRVTPPADAPSLPASSRRERARPPARRTRRRGRRSACDLRGRPRPRRRGGRRWPGPAG